MINASRLPLDMYGYEKHVTFEYQVNALENLAREQRSRQETNRSRRLWVALQEIGEDEKRSVNVLRVGCMITQAYWMPDVLCRAKQSSVVLLLNVLGSPGLMQLTIDDNRCRAKTARDCYILHSSSTHETGDTPENSSNVPIRILQSASDAADI